MRGRFPACENCWCGKCYTPLGSIKFPIAKTLDEDGKEMLDPSGEGRFERARNGDHLMVPFQCELCHFRNIYGREPKDNNLKDKEFFKFARRANLDAVWSREPNTVSKNLGQLSRMLKTEQRFGFESTTPPIGPFPLEDSLGMKAAIAVLDRSLDAGIYSEHVQWATFRKSMSAISNLTQASVGGLKESVGAYQRNKMWISSSVSHQFWFSRFMEGVHKRVGEIRKQDEALTIDVVHQIKTLLELEWKNTGNLDYNKRRRIAEVGTWFIVGFCTGMRGEEMVLIELAGTRNSMENMTDDLGYFKVVISGRTKGNQLSGSKFSFPCVNITKGTGLNPGTWIRRLIEIRNREDDTGGRLFFRGKSPAKVYQYQTDFFDMLYKVQNVSDFIKNDVDIGECYGILRSSRRGATAHARNVKIERDIIEAVHRWRQEAFGSGISLRLDLIDVYTTLDALAPTLLRYSEAF